MAKGYEEHKFTPRWNSHFQGHEKAEQEFLDVIQSGRMHHAWLICGPRGIGKATLAYRTARYLLAQDFKNVDNSDQALDLVLARHQNNLIPATATLCLNPEHPVFRRVASGSHTDFLGVERQYDEKTNKRQIIGIGNNKSNPEPNTIRFVGAFLRKTPADGGYRVVVIDSVDELSINAAHALLKILEEPPEHTLLLLVSHNPRTLLSTILSRCRQLSLHPLDAANVGSLIQRYAPETNEEEIKSVVHFSNGSIGLALSLLADDGLEMYHLVGVLLSDLPDLDISGIDKLGDMVAKDPSGKAFQTLYYILSYQLAEIAKANALSDTHPNSGISQWIDVWEETNTLFQKAESVNLDHKQVILNAFFAASAAAHNCPTGIL